MIEIETDRELPPEVRAALRHEAASISADVVTVSAAGVAFTARHRRRNGQERPFVRYDSLDVFLRFHPVSSQ